MKVSYELTRDDLAALFDFHHRTSPAVRRQTIGCFVISVAALMALPLAILITTDKPRLEMAMNIWPLLLGPILFVVFAIRFVRFRMRQMSNRMLREGQNTGYYGQCELTVGDDALTETRPSGSTSRNWSSVERIVTMPKHLFVYTSGIETYVVPRRAFSTEAEFNEFVHAISKHSGVEVNASG